MKKLFLLITVAATFVACTSKKTELETNRDLLLLQDSASMYNSSYLTDTGVVSSAALRGGTVDAKATNNVAPAPRRSTSTKRSSGTYSKSGGGSSTASSGTTQSTTQKKEGWSKAAKGAVIGGVGGAAAGAVIGKNAKGAVIGGVIGAAGGYIIGRSKDRKDGRVQ